MNNPNESLNLIAIESSDGTTSTGCSSIQEALEELCKYPQTYHHIRISYEIEGQYIDFTHTPPPLT